MSISVRIIDGPLPPATPAPPFPGAGAVLVFEGIARELEDGRPIDALDYQAYQPMAETMLRRIAADLIARHALLAMDIQHSRATVPVGQCSFRLTIHSAHRKEALAAMDEFIDRLKRDVPIWKKPIWRTSAT